MVRSIAVVLLSSAFLFGLPLRADDPLKKPAEPTDPSAVVHGDLGKRLDRFLTYTTQFPDGMSGSVLVAVRGEIVLEKGYGFADSAKKQPIRADALWDVASVTKQFTAAAILHLAMKGKVSLDDPLKKFFPDINIDKANVTLRQLLNHTSGIKNDPTFEKVNTGDRDATVEYILKLPMKADPGAEFAYSNVAYFLLGAIIEKVSGQTWEAYLKEHLFRPAGMKDTTCLGEPELKDMISRIPGGNRGKGGNFPYGNRKFWGYCGAGGVHATARDMYLWDRALRADKIFPKDLLKELYAVGKNDYALGWFIEKGKDGKTTVWHGGAVMGFSCYFGRLLEDDIVVVVLTNEFSPMNVRGVQDMGNALAGAAQGGDSFIPPEKPEKLDTTALAAYAGRYPLTGGGHLTVKPHPVEGLMIGTDDFATVCQIKKAESAMSFVDKHAEMLNGKLAKILEPLRAGDTTPFRAELPKAPADLIDCWLNLLVPAKDARGALTKHEVLGNYLVTGMGTYQFVRLHYEKGMQNVLFVWEGSRLMSVSPAGEMAVSLHLLPAGNHRFYTSAPGSWKARWVTFEVDGSEKVTKLKFSGLGAPLVGERAAAK
jgi:CubicO group peptidase (beta-lactamase class C family)